MPLAALWCGREDTMADVRMADARWACLTVERLKEERTPIDPILKKAGLT